MTIRKLDRRFGNVAVEMGFISVDQLIEAMNVQIREEIDEGRHRVLGAILFELGSMTTTQIDEVLKAMNPSDDSA